MKIGDRVRVRLSPHLEGDPGRTWGYIGLWWKVGIIAAIHHGDPWPVCVSLLEDSYGVSRFRPDELEVLP